MVLIHCSTLKEHLPFVAEDENAESSVQKCITVCFHLPHRADLNILIIHQDNIMFSHLENLKVNTSKRTLSEGVVGWVNRTSIELKLNKKHHSHSDKGSTGFPQWSKGKSES
jgi:hypothetical protein